MPNRLKGRKIQRASVTKRSVRLRIFSKIFAQTCRWGDDVTHDERRSRGSNDPHASHSQYDLDAAGKNRRVESNSGRILNKGQRGHNSQGTRATGCNSVMHGTPPDEFTETTANTGEWVTKRRNGETAEGRPVTGGRAQE